jgi:threonyl-tRNA synthetase
MINITYPDGAVKVFEKAPSGFDVALGISKGLLAKSLAIVVNDRLQDLSKIIKIDSKVKIITVDDAEGLEIIRHSCAHLLAQAVKRLYPSAQVTIGPVIEDGFYYDFYYPQGFNLDDLAAIEAKMIEIAQQNIVVQYKVVTKKEAIDYFLSINEKYKAEIIEGLSDDEEIKIYQQDDFQDLCRGPHVPSTSFLKAFKLTKVSGAYWRGDQKNEMLQRIYGTAWADKKQLRKYLLLQAEAKKRDHRLLAKKMDLFHIQQESPGMVFWHPNGWAIYQLIQDYVRKKYREYGYKQISTPQMVDSSLWQKSGHLDKFSDNMFIVESENRTYALKPMNCPCHVQVYNYDLRSYKDLPLRLAEMGSCHRSEPSGTLHGLMRVRNFIQDDGHIFCTEQQVAIEVKNFIEQITVVYKDFGFENFNIRFSTRPDSRVGSDDVWDHAEGVLQEVLEKSEHIWEVCPKEGAFYGPKLEFVLKDCLNRSWQCGTIQLDFLMPERLGATYVDSTGGKKIPVMIHRAMLGSLERFIGILLEHNAGCLPVWLASTQLVVASVTEDSIDYVNNLVHKLNSLGFRVFADIRQEKIGLKIREHSIKRVPFIAICGKKELENNTVALRSQLGNNLGDLHFDALVQVLQDS